MWGLRDCVRWRYFRFDRLIRIEGIVDIHIGNAARSIPPPIAIPPKAPAMKTRVKPPPIVVPIIRPIEMGSHIKPIPMTTVIDVMGISKSIDVVPIVMSRNHLHTSLGVDVSHNRIIANYRRVPCGRGIRMGYHA